MSLISKSLRNSVIALCKKGLDRKEVARRLRVAPGRVSAIKAQETAKKAIKWAKVKIARETKGSKRWQIVSFFGHEGRESRGIVDLLAIRRDHKSSKTKEKPLKIGDLFEIILVQVKGGGARMPSKKDRQRMHKVCDYYHAKEIVLASWKGTKLPVLYSLGKSKMKERPGAKFQWESCEMKEKAIKGLLR